MTLRMIWVTSVFASNMYPVETAVAERDGPLRRVRGDPVIPPAAEMGNADGSKIIEDLLRSVERQAAESFAGRERELKQRALKMLVQEEQVIRIDQRRFDAAAENKFRMRNDILIGWVLRRDEKENRIAPVASRASEIGRAHV